jgi:hypothetical protein
MNERPPCKCHGVPQLFSFDARYKAGGFLRCRVRRREYDQTPEGQASKRRYEAKRVRSRAGGVWQTYRVEPERKDELRERLADFRKDQSATYREVLHGGFDPAVP